jgi:phosphoenolpyruvate-protein kinase (PTS system EI component)
VVAELGAQPVPVGAMVETVAAAAAISELCEVADFLSIGTNDLTGQALGLDRTDQRARPELAAHPRVLDLVARVVRAADAAGRPVTVCGDAGAHPAALPVLLGVGVRQFSVACARIDETRYRLRRLAAAGCAELFAEARHLDDAEQVTALVRKRMTVLLP